MLKSAAKGKCPRGAQMNRHFSSLILLVVFAAAAMPGIAAGQSVATSNGKVPSGTSLVAQLTKSVDAKKARAGDPLKAKITQDVLTNGRIMIHRGSKLLGRVIEAKASGEQEPRSSLEMVFDRVSLKDGEELSFHAVLVALAPAVQAPDVLDASPSGYGGLNPGGSQPVSRGASRPITANPRDRVDHTREDALLRASDPSSYGSQSNTLRNGFLGSGNRGVFGMPEVSLKSGQLISTKADIKLESGTQIVLGVTANQ